jgi:hypothetical protein
VSEKPQRAGSPPTSGQRSPEESSPNLRAQGYSGHSEDLQTEVMRLRINEQQLLEEVTHLNRVNESLISQLDELRDRAALLESELDQQHQNSQELKRNLEQLELDHVHRERLSDQEKARLHQENEGLSSELQQLKELVQVKDRELREHAEQGEKERATLHRSLEDAQLQLNETREHDLRSELEELRRQNQDLTSQIERARSDSSSKRDYTVVSLTSLPQPNQSATNPDWARHSARYEQLMLELKILRQRCRSLKSKLRGIEGQSESLPPPSHTADALISSAESKEVVSPLGATEQAPSVDLPSPDRGIWEDTQLGEESEHFEEASSSSQVDEVEVNEDVNPSMNNRRAWKGLL